MDRALNGQRWLNLQKTNKMTNRNRMGENEINEMRWDQTRKWKQYLCSEQDGLKKTRHRPEDGEQEERNRKAKETSNSHEPRKVKSRDG